MVHREPKSTSKREGVRAKARARERVCGRERKSESKREGGRKREREWKRER